MRAQIYPIEATPIGRLAIMPRPRAGDWLEDELASWHESGLDVVVSLLDLEEIDQLGLSAEPALCEQLGMRFIHFPIFDRDVPPTGTAVTDLIHELVAELRAGRGVGVHCRMGIGRSACLAVCVLLALGLPLETAWSEAQQSRGLTIPDTPAQRAWVADWFARNVPPPGDSTK